MAGEIQRKEHDQSPETKKHHDFQQRHGGELEVRRDTDRNDTVAFDVGQSNRQTEIRATNGIRDGRRSGNNSR